MKVVLCYLSKWLICSTLYIFILHQYLLVVRGVSPRMSFPSNYSRQFCFFNCLFFLHLLLAEQCLDMSQLLRTDQKSIKNIYALNVRVFLEKLFKQQHVVIGTVRHAWKQSLGKYVRSLCKSNSSCSDTYPPDGDLSGGQRYPTFEQLGPGAPFLEGSRNFPGPGP